jgi:hypothetical protein
LDSVAEKDLAGEYDIVKKPKPGEAVGLATSFQTSLHIVIKEKFSFFICSGNK